MLDSILQFNPNLKHPILDTLEAVQMQTAKKLDIPFKITMVLVKFNLKFLKKRLSIN